MVSRLAATGVATSVQEILPGVILQDVGYYLIRNMQDDALHLKAAEIYLMSGLDPPATPPAPPGACILSAPLKGLFLLRCVLPCVDLCHRQIIAVIVHPDKQSEC